MSINEKVKVYVIRAGISLGICSASVFTVFMLKYALPLPVAQLIGTLLLGVALVTLLFGVAHLFGAALDYSALLAIRKYCRLNLLTLISTEITSKKYKAVYVDGNQQRFTGEWISSKIGFKNHKQKRK
jgi:hypothetical protein